MKIKYQLVLKNFSLNYLFYLIFSNRDISFLEKVSNITKYYSYICIFYKYFNTFLYSTCFEFLKYPNLKGELSRKGAR